MVTTDSGQTDEKTKNTYTITRVKGDIDWNSVPTLSLDNILWEPDCGIRANAQICYDDASLYVHLSKVGYQIELSSDELAKTVGCGFGDIV